MNFIETYDNALTSEMCKEIIHFFDVAPPEIKYEGRTSLGVNKNYKDSLDITMHFDRWTEPDEIISSSIPSSSSISWSPPQISSVLQCQQFMPTTSLTDEHQLHHIMP